MCEIRNVVLFRAISREGGATILHGETNMVTLTIPIQTKPSKQNLRVAAFEKYTPLGLVGDIW